MTKVYQKQKNPFRGLLWNTGEVAYLLSHKNKNPQRDFVVQNRSNAGDCLYYIKPPSLFARAVILGIQGEEPRIHRVEHRSVDTSQGECKVNQELPVSYTQQSNPSRFGSIERLHLVESQP